MVKAFQMAYWISSRDAKVVEVGRYVKIRALMSAGADHMLKEPAYVYSNACV
jgi:hypothetical protein